MPVPLIPMALGAGAVALLVWATGSKSSPPAGGGGTPPGGGGGLPPGGGGTPPGGGGTPPGGGGGTPPGGSLPGGLPPLPTQMPAQLPANAMASYANPQGYQLHGASELVLLVQSAQQEQIDLLTFAQVADQVCMASAPLSAESRNALANLSTFLATTAKKPNMASAVNHRITALSTQGAQLMAMGPLVSMEKGVSPVTRAFFWSYALLGDAAQMAKLGASAGASSFPQLAQTCSSWAGYIQQSKGGTPIPQGGPPGGGIPAPPPLGQQPPGMPPQGQPPMGWPGGFPQQPPPGGIPGGIPGLPPGGIPGLPPAVPPTQMPPNLGLPSPMPSQYTVQSGDTMVRITTERYKRPAAEVKALIAANPQVKDASKIYPGQVLNIPAHWSAAVAPPGGWIPGQNPPPPPPPPPGGGAPLPFPGNFPGGGSTPPAGKTPQGGSTAPPSPFPPMTWPTTPAPPPAPTGTGLPPLPTGLPPTGGWPGVPFPGGLPDWQQPKIEGIAGNSDGRQGMTNGR